MYNHLKNYFLQHQPHILFISLSGVLVNFLSRFPYLNLLFPPEVQITLLILLGFVVLKINLKFIWFFVLFFLIFIPIAFIMKDDYTAEKISNIVYALTVAGFAHVFVSYLRDIK